MENKRSILEIKGHFREIKVHFLEWSFLDVSSQNKISKIFLGALFSHELDMLTIKLPKMSPFQ